MTFHSGGGIEKETSQSEWHTAILWTYYDCQIANTYGNQNVLRVRFYTWLLNRDATLTWDNLSKRGRLDLSICILCNNSVEDNMLNCSFSALVWLKTTSLFQLHIDMVEGLEIWARAWVSKEDKGFAMMVASTIYWNLWQERNGRVFENTSHTIDDYVLKFIMIFYSG